MGLKPINFPDKWVTEGVTPISGVTTLIVTGDGACRACPIPDPGTWLKWIQSWDPFGNLGNCDLQWFGIHLGRKPKKISIFFQFTFYGSLSANLRNEHERTSRLATNLKGTPNKKPPQKHFVWQKAVEIHDLTNMGTNWNTVQELLRHKMKPMVLEKVTPTKFWHRCCISGRL